MNLLYVLAPREFYGPEYTIPANILKNEGINIITTSTDDIAISHDGIKVKVDKLLKDVKGGSYDAITICGGKGAEELAKNVDAKRVVKEADRVNKVIAAICHGPLLLGSAGILENVGATCWPEAKKQLKKYGADYTGIPIEVCGNIITAQTPEDAKLFAELIVSKLRGEGGLEKREAKKQISKRADKDIFDVGHLSQDDIIYFYHNGDIVEFPHLAPDGYDFQTHSDIMGRHNELAQDPYRGRIDVRKKWISIYDVTNRQDFFDRRLGELINQLEQKYPGHTIYLWNDDFDGVELEQAHKRCYRSNKFASRGFSVLGPDGVDPADPYGGKDVRIPGKDPMKQKQVLPKRLPKEKLFFDNGRQVWITTTARIMARKILNLPKIRNVYLNMAIAKTFINAKPKYSWRVNLRSLNPNEVGHIRYGTGIGGRVWKIIAIEKQDRIAIIGLKAVG